MDNKIVKAGASFVHTSPRKLRLVADAVRSMAPTEAMKHLKMLPKRAAGGLFKVYSQAVANAKNNFGVSPAGLQTKSLQIQEGPRGPKRLDKSHSARFNRGLKRRRFSHVSLVLEAK